MWKRSSRLVLALVACALALATVHAQNTAGIGTIPVKVGADAMRTVDLGALTVQQVIDNNYQPILLYTPKAGEYVMWLDYDLPSLVKTNSLFIGVVADPSNSNYAYADPSSLVTFGLYVGPSGVSNYSANFPGYSSGSRLYQGALYLALTNGMTMLRRWTANTSAPFGFAVRGSDGHQWDNYQTQGGVGTTSGASEPDFAHGHGGYVADAPNAYQYDHVYALNATIIGNDIHTWKATTGGTSSGAGSQPDFHSLEMTPVADGPDTLVWEDQGASVTPYVRWWDAGVAPTSGSIHVFAVVTKPTAP